jgi:hypothetical protein
MRGPTTSDLPAIEWGTLTTAYLHKYGRPTLKVCDAICEVHGLGTIEKYYVLSAQVVAQERSMRRQSDYLPQVGRIVLECVSLAIDIRRVTKSIHAYAKRLDLSPLACGILSSRLQ